ncbi:hypothetical protein BWZ22_14785 [Seonamhaeicola sp. S2-3]|nr:hypothetical protein BWZ22_14785 [Seonamhaeicola sp. S2-3]
MTMFMSCNNEELFIEDVVEEVVDDTAGDDTEETPEEETDDTTNEDTEVDASLPCDFDLNDVAAGDTVVINCVMDLEGATVNLPSNVTILYEGGDIINGTLNFSDNTTIDGNLLNSTITLAGSTPALKDPVFDFIPERWGIVEGKVSSEVAQRNNNILEDMMIRLKEFGVNTLKIGEMDAYFEVSKVTSTTTNQNFYPSQEAINVPSDFTLEMSDDTYLRVQPNGRKNYALLAVRDESNVVIKGGNLYGDRFEHDDDLEEGLDAYGHVLIIHGATNVEVDGVLMAEGTGDGLDINSIGFTFEPHYTPSNNIRVFNCIFRDNRRNNVSITDGFNMLLENNLFENAGKDYANSKGMAPGYGLDVEAYRSKDSNGNYIWYEKAYDITIRNNVERGSKRGSFIVAIGDNVTIEGNDTEGGIAIGAAAGVNIIGNTITARPGETVGSGITTGHPNSITTYNNVISGNTIIGYNIGIAAYQKDMIISDNYLVDFSVGIQPKDIKNTDIYNNKFESSRDTSTGIFGNITSMENVNIYNNEIVNVGREGIKMVNVNKGDGEENYKITIENNSLKNSGVTLSNAIGVDYVNNESQEGVTLVNAEKMNIDSNTINSENQDGIRVMSGCKDISISNNDITVSGKNVDCVDVSSDGVNINLENNSCQ